MGTTANVLVGVATVTITCAANQSGGLQESGTASITGFYTVDGVSVTVRSSFADIKVEENVGTVIRRLTDQEMLVTLTFAEGTLDNLVAAIAGSAINAGGTVVTIGGGLAGDPLLQDFELDIVGVNPAGAARTINIPHCNPTGEVGIPYKKGEVSVVPVTFSALVSDAGVFATITDA
ncbi:MAG: hypothetical protein PHU08_00255 [Dehalococcoidales bacterium]|nr:hypothetical protein [Dehalococcoidales bacterium]